MKASELRSKSAEELQQELTSLLEEQFKLRMQYSMGQASRNHEFSRIRKFNPILFNVWRIYMTDMSTVRELKNLTRRKVLGVDEQ